MAEYIEREAAVSVIEAKQKEICPVGRYGRGYVYGTDREKYDNWEEIIDALENINAADVVPVVRCRECKHYREIRTKRYKNLICRCTRMGKHDMDYPVKPDDFCSYGERSSGAPLEDYDFEFC